jgi:type II secretory pathway pseudopilin PulG
MNFIKYRKARSSAFTIIELLVAVGVTALLVSLMLTIVTNVMGGWSRSSGTLTAGNQARTVLDMITSDLQSLVLRRDGNVWLVASIQTSPSGEAWDPSGKLATTSSSSDPNSSLYLPALTTPVAQPPNIEDYRFGKAGVWLRMITNVPDTNASGDLTKLSAPRAVAYQIIRTKATASANAEEHYLFYRSELSPDVTFTTGYNLLDSTKYYTSGAGSILRTPTSGSDKSTWLVANNVVDFGVRFFTRRSTGELDPVFPNTNDLSFAATTDTTKVGPGPDATPVRQIPDVAEVFIRILTDEGVTQIALMENAPAGYTAPGSWWDVVLANSRVYTRRVEIKAKGL